MAAGSSAPSQSKEISDYNEADAILWQNMVTLPLYQKPQFWAWSNNLKGVLPNTSSVGRHLERRRLVDQLVADDSTEREGGVGRTVGPSLNASGSDT